LNVSGNVDAGNWLPFDATLLVFRCVSIIGVDCKKFCYEKKREEININKTDNKHEEAE
jgi:hypothetical protein